MDKDESNQVIDKFRFSVYLGEETNERLADFSRAFKVSRNKIIIWLLDYAMKEVTDTDGTISMEKFNRKILNG